MQRNFRSVRELGVDCLKRILPSGSSMEVSKLDYLCYNCFTHFTEQITLRSSELGVYSFMPPEEAIEDLNRSARSTFVSPLRPPSEVRRRDRPAYVKRKQTELEQVVTENLRSRMPLAYDENVASGSSEQKCSTCTEWADNIRRAFATTASPRERCQLLTLLPSTLTRHEVQKILPEASIYIINRSRMLREDHGVWYVPDPYTRCKMSPENISAAVEYYIKDEQECYRQSPNQKDVISVVLYGQKTLKPKRFMTRSIREAFRVYKSDHPDSGIGLTKFYSL
ncbi:hypothetical protein HPB47_021829 [Ixodes persulcatus]|uniref:Uncharacterized protein n=1 Tax=Ixodes persulcatus TaxID=34615 RepID=A0AC60QCE1_IXOPE|nr:hypothetical protein HPB47_021829 [Ixodes persulcatus]